MIPIYEPDLSSIERKYLLEAIDSGWISSQGSFIEEFERAFAQRFEMQYGVSTSNCTSALHLSLVALGIGAGDEVICPDLTFIAPANMVALTGAIPVLVDVEADTWNLSPESTRLAITERTKAIIVVHSYGHAASMEELQSLAAQHEIPVIEDNAESPGGCYKDKILGSFGKVSCFSFYANKILTTGEGGMVLTDDEELYYKLRELRDHGMSRHKRYLHVALGFNYRMTNMQAAIGMAQLERFETILEKRQSQEEFYNRMLSGNDSYSIRPQQPWSQSVHWMMTVQLNISGVRDALLDRLKEKGVDCRQMIYPVHEAQHFKQHYDDRAYPVSKQVSHNSLHLPSSTQLTEEQIEWITGTFQELLKEFV
jgi:perosamine synthetase